MASGDLSGMPEVKDMAVANTNFTFDLLLRCAADAKGQNIFFAPYSISTALAMTCLGADGCTAEEMKRVLKWSSGIPKSGFGSYLPMLYQAPANLTTSSGYILVGAQRMYVRKDLPLKPQFSTEMKQYFASQAMTADFAGNFEGERKSINSWVEEQTRNKIKELLSPGSINGSTAMVLVQAIYFKGNWTHKFHTKNTHLADFFTPQGPVRVNMMQQTKHFKFGGSKDLGCTAVELPYASNNTAAGIAAHDLSMLILLPNAQDGLEKLELSLTPGALENLRTKMWSAEVTLKLPRFSVESEFNLKNALSQMGMPHAFSEENADFSGITDGKICISEVFHKAVVEVNEEGSEAAAATAFTIQLTCVRIPVTFTADHPFLFFIVDTWANVVLFSGRLVNPRAMA